MDGFKHFFSPLIIDTAFLRVLGIGVREQMPPCRVVRPQGTGDFLFMLFHDAVTLTAGGLSQSAPAGSLVLWPPEAGHDYGTKERSWSHSWIHCDGTRVVEALHDAGLPLDRLLVIPEPDWLVRHLEWIYEEIVGQRPDVVIVGNLLENALRGLARALAPDVSPAARIPESFLALRQRLERTPQQAVSLARLARSVNLSAPHFSAQWRRYFHVSPIEDVIRMRIDHAKYLLLDESRRVADVARAVGIEDAYRFSKIFHKRVGLSPRAYRTSRQT